MKSVEQTVRQQFLQLLSASTTTPQQASEVAVLSSETEPRTVGVVSVDPQIVGADSAEPPTFGADSAEPSTVGADSAEPSTAESADQMATGADSAGQMTASPLNGPSAPHQIEAEKVSAPDRSDSLARVVDDKSMPDLEHLPASVEQHVMVSSGSDEITSNITLSTNQTEKDESDPPLKFSESSGDPKILTSSLSLPMNEPPIVIMETSEDQEVFYKSSHHIQGAVDSILEPGTWNTSESQIASAIEEFDMKYFLDFENAQKNYLYEDLLVSDDCGTSVAQQQDGEAFVPGPFEAEMLHGPSVEDAGEAAVVPEEMVREGPYNPVNFARHPEPELKKQLELAVEKVSVTFNIVVYKYCCIK